jgi:nitroreductase
LDIHNIIKSRRSTREFYPDPIDPSIIQRIMDSATWAPSPFNSQNWKFYVLTGNKRDQFAIRLQPVFDEMKDAILKTYGPKDVEIRRKLYQNAGDAPVIIVCYAEDAWNGDLVGPSMACQNILLAAESEGLGSLFMGAARYVKDSINEMLGETELFLVGAILIGKPKVTAEPLPRKDGKVFFLN